MKKPKAGIAGVHDQGHLFRGVALKRHRRLILPRLLNEEAAKPSNRGTDLDAAHAIFVRWADLESNGHLLGDETSLDEPFRQEIFGTALRYLTAPTSPNAYYYDKKLYVPGVGTPDGVLGEFPPVEPRNARAVIELKNATTDLDHDKFNGRTPVQQCWDYLNNLPDCPWGIVSNFVSFRLYHRDKTQQAFEHFELQKLRDIEEFARFYALFERNGLLASRVIRVPRALALIERTQNRQREVGDKLYDYYSDQRHRLIEHLMVEHARTRDQALRAAQKLLDRIIFVAFCEDRGLLPYKLIESTWKNVAPLARVTNPRWKNFLDMFHAIDQGHPTLELPTGYNGGLFAPDENVDELDLKDSWTTVFQQIGEYDFAEDVNVDVLGHLFEKSVSEIEKIRTGGAFFTPGPDPGAPAMPKSAERKRFGIYYTPPEFTRFIVQNTVGTVIEERFAAIALRHGVDPEQSMRTRPARQFAACWRECLDALRQIRIVDPACGSGAFLIAAYELLEDEYQTLIEHLARHTGEPAAAWADAVPEMILAENLHGVDLSPEAVEITQLALWIRSARKGRRLDDLSRNVICGNSLVTDPEVHPRAMQWREAFPAVFERTDGGFDCVIGNPPWERLKLQEREFFAFSRPDIASAVSAATRRALIARLEQENPELFAEYVAALNAADATLAHVRKSGEYPLTARGDINTYMVFAELARKIVRPNGRIGLLVPSGIATDDTTKGFFADLMSTQTLTAIYDFENRKKVFSDVDGRFKFSILLMGGINNTEKQADFVFFAHEMRDLSQRHRHIELSEKDLALLNPNTRTCPIFRSRRDAELVKAIYRRVPILIDENRSSGGNPWSVRFFTMFHQTNDAEHFLSPAELRKAGAKPQRNCWRRGKTVYLPLYEAKMVQAYDHRAASVVITEANWVRQGQTEATSLVEHQNPEFVAMPRWWTDQAVVLDTLGDLTRGRQGFIAYKDITSPTNQRTMIAAAIPWCAATNHLVLMLTQESPRREFCLLGNLNSIAYDYITRQKIGGVTLNYFIVRQIPTFPPDAYDDRCPWNKRQTLEKWISDRVLKLTCTADDMRPLAEAAGFKPGVHKWKEAGRAELRAELDAAYFHLYGISREDAAYILSTFQGMTDGDEGSFTPTSAASCILESYDRLAASM